MLGLIELATHADASFWIVVRVFGEQIAIGLAVGLAGGFLEGACCGSASAADARARRGRLRRRRPRARLGLPRRVRHGACRRRRRGAVSESLQDRLASAAEVVVFVALGLTIHLSGIGVGRWAEGLALAAFVALVARPASSARCSHRCGYATASGCS